MKRGLWILLVLSWGLFVGVAYWLGRNGNMGSVDFDVYFATARSFTEGISPYQGTVGMVYLYPPLLAQLLTPMSGLDPLTAWQLWFAFNIALLIGTVAVFSRTIPARFALVLWASPLLFQPILDSLYIGQVTIILLTLLTGVYVLRYRHSPVWAGALLALATWLKIWPGFLLLYFIWKRDWGVVLGCGLSGIALAGLQIAFVGWDTFIDSFGVLFGLAGVGQPERAYTSISILGFTSQLFESNVRVTALLVNPALFALSRIGLSALVVIGLAVASFRPVRETTPFDPRRFGLEYSLALLTAMLLSPTLWASGMPPMLFSFWLIWLGVARRQRIIVALALILISCHSWFMIGYEGKPELHALVLSFGFVALASLWGLHLPMLRALRRVSGGAP